MGRSTGPWKPRQESLQGEEHGRELLKITDRETKEQVGEQAKKKKKAGKGKGSREEIQLWLQTLKNVPGDRWRVAKTLDKLRLDFCWISLERKEADERLRGCSGVTSKMLRTTAGEIEDLGSQWNCPRGGDSKALLRRTVPGADGWELA